jgi:quinol monooxygenase YgiN
MMIQHGFHATIPAHVGRGDALAALLLAAPSLGNEHCLVFLVSRSAENPDLVSVAEGWSSREAHARFFASPEAQAFVAQLAPLIAGESIYSDGIPVGGKAILA